MEEGRVYNRERDEQVPEKRKGAPKLIKISTINKLCKAVCKIQYEIIEDEKTLVGNGLFFNKSSRCR